jgi:hypothetical protein
MAHKNPTTEQVRRMIRRRRAIDAPAVVAPNRRMLEPGAPDHATAATTRQAALQAVQKQAGNQTAQRAVAQRSEPTIRDTKLGVLLIAGEGKPIPTIRDVQRDMPVSASVYERLREVVDILVGGSTEIEMKGEGSFRLATLLDLAWLFKQPSGRELIESIARAGKRIKIEEAKSGGDGLRALAEQDATVRPDGTPGRGSEIELRYGPESWSPSGTIEQFEKRKPAQGLARSLVQMLPMLTGTAPSTRERDPVANGAQATGPDPLLETIRRENRFRAAFGMPLRPEE